MNRAPLILAVCIVLAIFAVPLAKVLADLAAGLAVLVIAGAGLWLIASAPFRNRM